MRFRSRHTGLAALTLLALSLPRLRASAQTEGQGDEQPEEKAKAAKSEKAAKAESTEAEAPASPAESAPPPPAAPSETTSWIPAPAPPIRVESSVASMQFGLLAQPQFEVAGAPDADKTTKNIFVRRIRLMVGGTLFKNIEFFFDVDWPNLFKLDPSDTMAFDKNAPGLNVQDAFVTWKPLGELVKVDAGFMLPPLSHNGVESAAKLYGGDYFVNTFRRNVTGNADPFRSSGQSPAGRDTGVQLRALVFNGHIDLRGGAFQGHRLGAVPQSTTMPAVVGGLNAPRVALRLQINLLDAEPGFFYAGTYHGTKKVVSIGGFYDFQDKYKYFGGDVLVDLPLGPGILTAQSDIVHWDGGTFITLPKATVYMGEIGYLIGPAMLSPIFRIERLVAPLIPNPDMTMTNMVPDPSNPSEDRYSGGLAFWPYGHNTNLKAFVTRVHRAGTPHDFNVINVQWQVYVY
jgi:hypothetical protein